MNFLKNKVLLRGLLAQGDQWHTINGGVAQFQIEKEYTAEGVLLKVKVPSVSPESYQVVAHGSRLIIQVNLPGDVGLQSGIFQIPMHQRIVDIPAGVEVSGIDAVSSSDGLRILLPFQDGFQTNLHPINIRREE